MRENFGYVKRIGFPDEATADLESAWGQVCGETSAKAEYDEALRLFLTEGEQPYKEKIDVVGELSGVSPRAVEMLVLIGGLNCAKERFLKAGYTEELFLATMSDLKNKLLECKKVYGVWGAFTIKWLRNYYFCERFALGRLQYEIADFPFEEYKGMMKQGEKVLCCHIPSSGPLNRADVIESLKKAYAFYPQIVKDGVLTVVCNSWLLYPNHYPLFKEGGNIRAFYHLFDVVGEWESCEDFWRIFGYFYDKEKVALAGEENSLQKSFKAYLLAGNTMGGGRGVLQFDGEKVLTERE